MWFLISGNGYFWITIFIFIFIIKTIKIMMIGLTGVCTVQMCFLWRKKMYNTGCPCNTTVHHYNAVLHICTFDLYQKIVVSCVCVLINCIAIFFTI